VAGGGLRAARQTLSPSQEALQQRRAIEALEGGSAEDEEEAREATSFS